LVSNAGSPAGEGIKLSTLSLALPVLSATNLMARRGSTASKQKLAMTIRPVKTVVSIEDNLFPFNQNIAAL
jgi:hypothetical protein